MTPPDAPVHASGCLVCGAALRYSQSAEPVACTLCGATSESTARCGDGHYVCDRCHAAPSRSQSWGAIPA
ncbi:MAG TPA: hypothetical protein VLT47_09235 [Anaeromyxobacteraceae bacterium]|nr:hypothetical protein [Anaeromyxobacteraceae bacterium]